MKQNIKSKNLKQVSAGKLNKLLENSYWLKLKEVNQADKFLKLFDFVIKNFKFMKLTL